MKKVALLILSSVLSLSVAQAEKKKFDYMDVFELEYASDPQFTNGGDTIIYVRNFMDVMEDRKRSNLWRVDKDGDHHRPLTTGLNNNTSPRISPDGSKLAYISNENGKSEIMIRFMDTGQTFSAAQLQSGPSSLSWSPNGEFLAFSMFQKADEETYAPLPGKPEGANWAPKAVVQDKLLFSRNGSGYGKLGNSHIFVLPALGGTPRQVTSGEFDHGGGLSWGADSGHVYFSANRKENREDEPQDSEIYAVNINDGTITALTDRFGGDHSPAVSPDGDRIAYLGYDDVRSEHHHTHLYVMDIDGDNKRQISNGPDVESFQWDGDNLYIAYSDRALGKVARLSMRGDVRDLTETRGGLSFGRPYGGNGDFTVYRGDIAYSSANAYDHANISYNDTQITDLNGDILGHRDLASVEEINFTSSHDGIDLQGWLMRPPGFDQDKDYPMILEIHGGPITHYGPYFSAEMQLMAAQGYMVLYINQRGSTSYGEDFANLLHHNYPNHDFDDVMSGVDHAVSLGNVDVERIYITGGSNGGILSSWAIGKTDRFRAAVVAKPLTNWVTGVLNSVLAKFSSRYEFAQPFWENHEEYWKRSPLSLVGNVKTPTMLMTGEDDVITPIAEAEQYYQALKLRGVDTMLVRIPGAGHGITARPSHLITKVQHIVKWFDDHK